MRKLQVADDGSSGKVTLDKADLEFDGLVNDDGDVQAACIRLERDGRGHYRVVVLDDQLQPLDPGLRETEKRREIEAAD